MLPYVLQPSLVEPNYFVECDSDCANMVWQSETFESDQLQWKPAGLAVLHTSKSLVAWCNRERALLHSQLVKFGELWRNSSRGRLWEWEEEAGREETEEMGKTQEEGEKKTKNRAHKNHNQYRRQHKEVQTKENLTNTRLHSMVYRSLILSQSCINVTSRWACLLVHLSGKPNMSSCLVRLHLFVHFPSHLWR